MPYPTNPQPWAVTGAARQLADFRTGFWCDLDNGSIDAPFCLPGGSTVKGFYLGERNIIGEYNIIGGVVVRDGGFQ